MSSMLCTAEVVAKMLSVPTSKVYTLVRKGDLPVVKVGKAYRFRLQEVEDFISNGGTLQKKHERHMKEQVVNEQVKEVDDQPILGNAKKESIPVQSKLTVSGKPIPSPIPIVSQPTSHPRSFSTRDMWEATIALALGHPYTEVEYSKVLGRFVFHFDDTESLRDDLGDHVMGRLTINTKAFLSSYRQVKNLMRL